MLKKSEFNLKSALSAISGRGQGGDARPRSKKLTVILSTVLIAAILAGVVMVGLPGSRASAASSVGVLNSVYGESVIPGRYVPVNVPAGTNLMTYENYSSEAGKGTVTTSTDGVASFDFHIFADKFSSGVHTCGNIAVNLLGAEVLGNAAAPEFGSRSEHDVDTPKLSYVGDLYGWSSATTNEYLVFGNNVDVTGNGQVWVELADGNTAMMGNDNGGNLLDTIYIENNGNPVADNSQLYIDINAELDEAENYQRWLIWLMKQANAQNGNKSTMYSTTIGDETVQYLHYNDLVTWNYWGWSTPNLDFSSYDADTIVIDLPTYVGYDWWSNSWVNYSYATQLIYNTVKMTGTAGKRIVFNVCTDNTGDNFTFFSTTMSADNLSNSEGTAELDNNILWNFYETDSNGVPVSYDGTVSVSGTWVGSILAPDATVSCGAGLNGSIIAKNVVTFCETHKSDYTGERVTNTNTEITVTKVWQDDPNTRPAYITVQLFQNGEVVSSVQLTESNVLKDEDGKVVDSNTWTYTWTDLPAADANGTSYQYKVSEVVPAGYKMDQVGNTIINTGTGVPEDVGPTYSLTVTKNDGTDNLAGASLTLTSASGANLSGATVENGTNVSVTDNAVNWVSTKTPAIISGLPAGTYNIYESSAPSGYKVAAAQTIVINSDGATATVVNSPITVEINKFNGANDYKDQLPGASFKLTSNWWTAINADMVSGTEATKVDDWNLTWTNGTEPVTLTGIPAGSYTLTETAAPDGYELAAPITFIVNTDGSVYVNNTKVESVDMTNYLVPVIEEDEEEPVYTLTVTKTGGATYNALPGASMTLTSVAGKNLSANGDYTVTVTGASSYTINGNTISWVTGNSAVAFAGLPAGNYVVSETAAPDGYEKAADISITLNADNSVSMHDNAIELNISKLDSISGAQLTGASMTLTEVSGKVLSGVTSSTVTLDCSSDGKTLSWTSNGKAATLTNLPAGTYTLTEADAPNGYEEAASQTFTVDVYGNVHAKDKDNNATSANVSGTTVTMYDAPVTIDIGKNYWNDKDLDETTANSNNATEIGILPGAKLQLTADVSLANVTGSITVTHVDDKTITWTSGSKANTLRGLPDGKYTLTELEAPAGYDSANAITFEVSSGEVTNVVTANTGDSSTASSVTMCDKKTVFYSVKISKVDSESNSALPGATIGIFEEGTTNFSATNAVVVFESTNAPEQLILANGNYILREISAPEGYDLNEECICFTVNNGNVEITEVYTTTGTVYYGSPSDVLAYNKVDSDGFVYADITDYILGNGDVPDHVKLSVDASKDIPFMNCFIIYTDTNGNWADLFMYQQYNSAWKTQEFTSPTDSEINDYYTYMVGDYNGEDVYYFGREGRTQPDINNFGAAYLIFQIGESEDNANSLVKTEADWTALDATVSVVYGEKEVVLGEKSESSANSGASGGGSSFTYGTVPVIGWQSSGNFFYSDITEILDEKGELPSSFTCTVPDDFDTANVYNVYMSIVCGNMTDYPSCYNLYNNTWVGLVSGTQSYSVNLGTPQNDYSAYETAKSGYSDTRAYLVVNLNSYTLDSSTVDFGEYVVSLGFSDGSTVVTGGASTTYSAEYDTFNFRGTDINGMFVDVTDILEENGGLPYEIYLSRPVSDDNVEVTNVVFYTLYEAASGTGSDYTGDGKVYSVSYSDVVSSGDVVSNGDVIETHTIQKSGSKNYDAAAYDEAYVIIVATFVDEDGNERTVSSVEEWEALGFSMQISLGENLEPIDLGSFSYVDKSVGATLPSGDVTITGDVTSGEPVVITLPNKLTPVADRYVHSVLLSKVDEKGNAITYNPATFMLYDSKGNPVRLSGSDGSYQYDYSAAGECVFAQTDFTDGAATKWGASVSQLPVAINYELGALVDGLTLSLTITNTNDNSSVTLPTITPTSTTGSWKNIDLSGLNYNGWETFNITLTQTYADGQNATSAELDFVYPLTTSNAAGTIRVDNLELGDYYFVETKAPTNYKNDNGNISVSLTEWNTSDNPAKVTVTNTELTGSLIIEKTDDSGRPLSGAQFVLYVGSDLVEGDEEYNGLYRWDDISVAVNSTNSVGTYTFAWIWGESSNNVMTTGEDGQIKITGLPLGHVYYVKEITAAPGTENSNAGKNLPALTVGSSTVEGTAYYNENNLYGTALGENITTYIPTYTWNDVDNDGIYDGEETEGEVTVTYESQNITKYEDVISVSNKAFTTKIDKVNEDNAFLPGAELVLEPISDVDLSGVSGSTTTADGTAKATLNTINVPIYDTEDPTKVVGSYIEYVSVSWTSGTGSMVLRGLPSGFYKLTELDAPEGYAVADPIYIYIDASGKAYYSATESTDTSAYTAASDNTTVTMLDEKLTGKITLTKRDGKTNERMSGVKFLLKSGNSYVTVTGENGVYKYSDLAASGTELTTAADGTIVVTGLPYGTSYTFVETVPTGFKVDDTETTVQVTVDALDKNVTVTNTREDNGSIVLTKTVEGTQTAIDGAQFVLMYRKAGTGAQFVQYGTEIYTTKDGGKITVSGLPWGYDYKFVETVAADGYDINTAKYSSEFVTINSNTTGSLEFNVTNRAKLSVSVVKSWDDNGNQDGKQPASVEVQLKADGVVSETVTLNQGNGWTYVWTGLNVVNSEGKDIVYSVDEATVPTGYTKEVSGSVTDGFIIKNTYTTYSTTGVTVTKQWIDSNNQDGIRPGSISVQLKADETPVGDAITLNADNNWTYTWTGLAVNKAGGGAIEYTVEESGVPEGYTPNTTGDAANGFTITNTHATDTTELTVKKEWVDNENQDGIRPGSVSVQLKADETPVGDAITLNAENNWTYTWTGLAVNAGGNAISYSVEEATVSGYTPEYNREGNTITIKNTHETEKTSVSVEKIWSDNNDQDGLRPEDITVKLLANGAEAATATLNEGNSWAHTWSDLDTNAGGSKITYTVEEIEVEGYESEIKGDAASGFEIVNVHETAEISFSVTKVWEDNDDQDGIRPDYVTVQLKADGENSGDAVTLNEENDWTYEWSNMPAKNDGETIEYTVVESGVPTGYDSKTTGDTTTDFVITNTHTPDTVEISVKKQWSDNDNQDGIRENFVTVQLKANNVATDIEGTLNQATGWSFTWNGLPKYKNGEEIQYTVEETNVPDGYTPSVTGNAADGYTITNTHTPEKINIPVTKTWSDSNDFDGLRPEKITVVLLKNNVETTTTIDIEADADGNWSGSFTNLPKCEGGVEIVYGIKELEIRGYESEITGSAANCFVINNSHTPEKVNISVTKTWSDSNDFDGLRPDEITVVLLKDGEETTTTIKIQPDAQGNWIGSFTDLPKYDDGVEIVYGIKELEIRGYESEITGNAANGFVINNSHTPEKVNISVTKTWSDSNDFDGLRPDEITIVLLKDGEETTTTIKIQPDAQGNWIGSFTDLPKYDDGVEIVYGIKELEIRGYESEITGNVANGFVINNSHTPEKVNISVTKTWSDSDDFDGLRPDEITVVLLKDGEETTTTIKIQPDAQGNWIGSFTDLPKYDDGVEIVYGIKELEIRGYESEITGSAANGFIIENTHTPEKVNISVTKTWSDSDDFDGLRPDEITVVLLEDGEETETTLKIEPDDQGNWSGSFTDLPKFKNGVEINYSVGECDVAGYTSIRSGDVASGYLFINTHIPVKINIPVTKTWSDSNDQDGLRPEKITVVLLKGGEETETTIEIEPDDQGNWSGSFTNLPKYEDGVEIVYSVKESGVPTGYSSVVTGSVTNGFTIANSHTPEKVNIPVTKTWSDSNDQDGLRPEKITVVLLKGGNETETTIEIEPDDQGNWRGSFTNLPKYDDGVEIAYSVKEVGVPTGYTSATTGNAATGFTITNTHVPTTTTISVSKKEINGTNELPGATLILTPADGIDLSGVTGTIEVEPQEDGSIKWVSGTTANTLTKLPAGQYTLTEITAPNGYEVAESITFTVDSKGDVYIGEEKQNGDIVVMEDAPVTVTISKVEINGTNELPGATLILTPADGIDLSGVTGTIEVEPQEDGSIKWVSGTTANTLTKLPAGQYTLTEITAPNGYEVAESITFTVDSKGDVYIGEQKQNGDIVVMEDAPVTVTISKVEINGTDELPGATLILTPYEGIDLSGVTGTITVEPQEDGSIKWVSDDEPNVLSKLPAGAYTLTEITAPDGYLVAEEITFTVNENGEVYIDGEKQDGSIVVMEDAPVTITISKVEINGTDELPGATLVLTPEDEDIDLSDVTGTIDVDYSDKDGSITWVSEDEPNKLSKLPAGEYTLTEITAPNGYDVAEDITFTVDEDGDVYIGDDKQDGSIIVMEDAPNKAVISKQATGGGDELVGAKLTVVLVAPEDEEATLENVTGTTAITLSNDKSSVTWTSGSTANTLTYLPDGVYTLIEESAPAGYKVAESMFFKVDNGVVYNTTNYTAATTVWTKADEGEVIMFDDRISVAISFTKFSNLDKTLAGAVFTLTNSSGVSKTATSGSNGVVAFDNLEQGTYTLKETSAPNGYTKSNSTITVEVNAAGTVIWRDAAGYQIIVSDVEKAFTNSYVPKQDESNSNLNVGDKIDLSTDLEDILGDLDVKWESTNDNIASVDQNGNVTIKTPGKVTITVKYDDEVVKNFVLGATDQNNSVPNTGNDIVRLSMYVSGALLGAFGITTAVVYGVKRRRQHQA